MDELDEVRRRVRGPAAALLCAAVGGKVVELLITAASLLSTPSAERWGLIPFYAIFQGITLLTSGLLLVAAWRLVQLKSYGFVVLAATVALAPLLSPSLLLGIPASLWTLATLADPAVHRRMGQTTVEFSLVALGSGLYLLAAEGIYATFWAASSWGLHPTQADACTMVAMGVVGVFLVPIASAVGAGVGVVELARRRAFGTALAAILVNLVAPLPTLLFCWAPSLYGG
jgi:hypothetical protein